MRNSGKTSHSGKKPIKKGNREEVDDATLWHRVTETVRPMKSNRATKDTVFPATSVSDNDSASKQSRVYKPQRAAAPVSQEVLPADNELNHGAAPGVDKRTNQRLIRGKLPIEGRLDLHGHTKQSAYRALEAFINGSFSAGRRCVIVITGKGLRLESGEVGILRQAVPQWLNNATLRPVVLAYSYATPKDGGEGALYVLLKRKR